MSTEWESHTRQPMGLRSEWIRVVDQGGDLEARRDGKNHIPRGGRGTGGNQKVHEVPGEGPGRWD